MEREEGVDSEMGLLREEEVSEIGLLREEEDEVYERSREEELDWTPEPCSAEDYHDQASSAEPLPEVATPPAAAPAPSEDRTPQASKEQRGSGRFQGLRLETVFQEETLFSGDAFAHTPTSPDSLFSDSAFSHEALPSPLVHTLSTFESIPLHSSLPARSASGSQLTDVSFSELGFIDVPLMETVESVQSDSIDLVGAVAQSILSKGDEIVDLSLTEVEGGDFVDISLTGTEGVSADEGSTLVGSMVGFVLGEEVDAHGLVGMVDDGAMPLARGVEADGVAAVVAPSPEAVEIVQDETVLQRATPIPCPTRYAALGQVLPFFSDIALVSELGRGGQGEVWLVRVSTADGTVFEAAAKFQSEGCPMDLLLQEAYSLVACRDCPHLIPLLGFTVYYNTLALLFALADAAPAWTLRGAGGQWTLPQLYQVAELFYRAVEGLAGMHGKGYLHCDVMPENLLFLDGVAKLSDLGLAVRADEVAGRGVGGSRGFIAPEVYCQEFQTCASDVYAVGKTLHALLTGTRPYEGFRDTKAILGFMAQGGSHQWPTEAYSYGSELVHLADACCAPRPDQRPTAATVSHHLLASLCA